MRRRKTSIWKLGGISALVLLGSCLTGGRAVAQPSIGISFEVFDRTLSPYGEWVAGGRLGRVWRPYQTVVGLDFQPYLSGGHWVYTDYGWSFESDYEWGWAPFHYGRWFLDDYYSWVWVPDTVWGPAWVDWRFGGGYVGWVPLAPVGFAINYSFYRPAWCFVPVHQFVVRDIYHYALPVDRVHWAYSVTSPVQQPIHHAGAQWNAGPPPGQVSQAIGQPIHPASIAPPPPGRVQPVRVASPAGVPAHGTTPLPSPGSGSPAYAPHSSPAPAPGYAAAAPHAAPPAAPAPGNVAPPPRVAPSTAPSSGYAAPAPHVAPPSAPSSGYAAPAPHGAPPAPSSDARWGSAPVGGSAHWAPSPRVAPAPSAPPPTPSSLHPWVASPGASSPSPEARWGQTPANIAPHWSGVAPAPAPRPSFGGSVSPAAPPSVPRPVAPAPRVAPAPAPSIHPSAPAPHPAPAVKQGFYSPRMYQGAPQVRTASAHASDARPFAGFSRPSAPVANRSFASAHSFGSVRHR